MQLNKMYRIFHDIKFELRDLDSNDGIFKKVLNLLSNVVVDLFKYIFQKIPQP